MKIKALITMLVLGSSSVAMARPVTVSGHAEATWTFGTVNSTRPIVRDHRNRPLPAPSPIYQPRQPDYMTTDNTVLGEDVSRYVGPIGVQSRRGWGEWTSLTQPTRIDLGREFFFFNGEQTGRFNTLMLKPNAGRSFVTKVAIQFAGDPTTQVVHLNRSLDLRSGSISIDLRGQSRAITRVSVYGESGRGAAYQLLAI